MKKSLIILSILFTFSGHSQSISSLLDSINKYKLLSPQKALDFGIEALEKSTGESISNDQLEINYNIGEILFYRKNYSKSLEYLTATLNIHEVIGAMKVIVHKHFSHLHQNSSYNLPT